VAGKKNDIVIVGGLRTPFGKCGGLLRDLDYYELAAISMRAVIRQANIPGDTVGEVFWGVGSSAACKDIHCPVAARQSLLKAGLPAETPSISFDMSGVSAMHAVKLAAMTIRAGEIDCAISGGAASFSREAWAIGGGPTDQLRLREEGENDLAAPAYADFNAVALDLDNLAFEYGIDRSELDEWAVRSHFNYGNARNAGKLKDEIIPTGIKAPGGESAVSNLDELYRPHASLEELSARSVLPGTRMITRGNTAQVADGSSAVLLMTRQKAIELGLVPLATVIANVSMAIGPDRPSEAQGYSILMILKKANLSVDDLEALEIDETSASFPIISLKMIGGGDNARLADLKDRTNVNGGALAMGNPDTAAGARVIMHLVHELRRRGGGYALGVTAGGLAQADACIIKVE
jgi:acetyl-CoA C-acetyltransferase